MELKMQMRTGRDSRLPYFCNLFSFRHRRPGRSDNPAAMGIQGRIPAIMVNNTILPVAAALSHCLHGPIGKAGNFRTSIGCQIHPVMETLFPVYRMLPISKRRRKGTGNGGAVIKSQDGLFQTDILRQVLVGILYILQF